MNENKITNEITINIEEILLLDDNSITDYETIRQIGLAQTKWNFLDRNTSIALGKKIKKELMYAALYPHVYQTHIVKPDSMSNTSWEIYNKMVNLCDKKRRNEKN